MSRSFVWLLSVGLGAAALGCSDPVPAAPAIGLRLNIVPSGSCAADPSRSDDLGNPPPDKDRLDGQPKKGRPVFNGEQGLDARCTVSGQGPFQITASAASSMVSMGISEGQIAAYGTPAQVLASPDPHVQHFIHAGAVETH